MGGGSHWSPLRTHWWAHQVPLDSPKPMVIEMALVKLNGSQKQRREHGKHREEGGRQGWEGDKKGWMKLSTNLINKKWTDPGNDFFLACMPYYCEQQYWWHPTFRIYRQSIPYQYTPKLLPGCCYYNDIMSRTLGGRGLRQEDQELETSLSHMANSREAWAA